MGDMAVEIAVFLIGDLAARATPERLRLIDHLELQSGRAFAWHAHRKRDVIGIAAYQRPQPIRIGKLLRIVLQMQHHAGAALRALYGLDCVVALSAGFPAHTLRRGRVG